MELTEEEIDEIGLALMREGLRHSDIDAYFEHHGVKGMKWGVRAGGAVRRSLSNDPFKSAPGFTRQGRSAEGTGGAFQTRKDRNIKRGLAFAATLPIGGIGLLGYNAIAKPVKGSKTQSGKAYVAKLLTIGVLGTPLSALAYHQMAAPVRVPRHAPPTLN